MREKSLEGSRLQVERTLGKSRNLNQYYLKPKWLDMKVIKNWMKFLYLLEFLVIGLLLLVTEWFEKKFRNRCFKSKMGDGTYIE